MKIAAVICLGHGAKDTSPLREPGMNFLLHRHLSHTAHGSPLAGVGAMLPDLWPMADRRVRPAMPRQLAWDALGEADDDTREVMRGIEHHLEADLWFHDAEVFRGGERATLDALRGAAASAKKLGLFAHPLWEMCLDGALVRKLGGEAVRAAVADGFAAATAAARTASGAHHFARADGGHEYRAAFDERMQWMADELAKGPWIEGYARADGLTRGLAGIRRRLGLPPFSEEDQAKIATAIATLAARADAAVEEILAVSR
jgi:hypothetical protein